MKRLYFILFICNITNSQSIIDLRLIDALIGSPLNQTTLTNDSGLNAILSLYGVSNYNHNYIHPYAPYQYKTIRIEGVYPSGLITDLTNYSSVIESATVSIDGSYNDTVRSQLMNLNAGSPIGINAGIIITNDSGLNTIFQNYNVFYYTQSFPSSSNNSLLRIYDVVCNCDKNLLKNALDNYSSIIESTENIYGGVQLLNEPFDNSKITISPNPFEYTFAINTQYIVSDYLIFDITGKQITSTSSKTELDNQTSKLQAGVYILNLVFDNGQTSNYKLVKK